MPAEPPPQPVPPLGPEPQPPKGPLPAPPPVQKSRTPATWLAPVAAWVGLLAASGCGAPVPEAPAGRPTAQAPSQAPSRQPQSAAPLPSQPPAPTDPEIVKQPPSGVDPQAVQPPPTSGDAGMAKRPPEPGAQPGGPDTRTQGAPARPSREDDCRGSAALCRGDSAK